MQDLIQHLGFILVPKLMILGCFSIRNSELNVLYYLFFNQLIYTQINFKNILCVTL